jgi:hypothetical protein
LLQGHGHLVGGQPERFSDVVADPDGERFAEVSFVAEAGQIELE